MSRSLGVRTASSFVDQAVDWEDTDARVWHLDQLPVLVLGPVVVVADDGSAILRVAWSDWLVRASEMAGLPCMAGSGLGRRTRSQVDAGAGTSVEKGDNRAVSESSHVGC